MPWVRSEQDRTKSKSCTKPLHSFEGIHSDQNCREKSFVYVSILNRLKYRHTHPPHCSVSVSLSDKMASVSLSSSDLFGRIPRQLYSLLFSLRMSLSQIHSHFQSLHPPAIYLSYPFISVQFCGVWFCLHVSAWMSVCPLPLSLSLCPSPQNQFQVDAAGPTSKVNIPLFHPLCSSNPTINKHLLSANLLLDI